MEKKLKIIVRIQKRAMVLFNESIARKYYNKKRLLTHTVGELMRLQIWFMIELEKAGRVVEKIKSE